MLRFALACLVTLSLAAIVTRAATAAEPVKHEGKIVKVEKEDVVIKDSANKEMTLMVGADTKITLDGKAAKLSDLSTGLHARFVYKKDGAKYHATSIEAKNA
jgi:hypothetical protein